MASEITFDRYTTFADILNITRDAVRHVRNGKYVWVEPEQERKNYRIKGDSIEARMWLAVCGQGIPQRPTVAQKATMLEWHVMIARLAGRG